MTQYDARNISMMMDLYEMTMAHGYFKEDQEGDFATFDVFYRRNPDGGGFAIFAGLEQVLEYLENLHFDERDIEYLRSLKIYDEDFLRWLSGYRFRGDVIAMPEGSIMYPDEPILTVNAPLIDAQLVETAILTQINHQSLVATKTQRIVQAAQGRGVADFGARRAHNIDAAVYGARAAYIGGCTATSGVLPARKFGIPVLQTMIHSWVQMFDSEYEAFCAYAQRYPDDCTFVVDTYDTLRSGVPNAIRAFNDVLLPLGRRPKSVRIDSGDIPYLSKRVRKMLDEAGFPDCGILASNSLDEHIISDMLAQGAKVDCFIVGERLITSASMRPSGCSTAHSL